MIVNNKNAKRLVQYYLFAANNVQLYKNIKLVSSVIPRPRATWSTQSREDNWGATWMKK
jgi:hypothetical protein